MITFLSDFFRWLWDVANNWAGYATGGLIVATVALYFTLRDKPMGRNIGIALSLFFLLFAFFKAWRDKDVELTKLQTTLAEPVFGGQLEFSADGDINGKLVIVVGGYITNPHGPQSAIFNWSLGVAFPDTRQTIFSRMVPSPNPNGVSIDFRRANNRNAKLLYKDYFPVINTPLAPGQ